MHHKNIKLSIRKQLKNQYPHWNRLNRKTKKEIARKVLAEVTSEYDFSGDITASHEELLAIEQQVPAKGIIKLDEMARFIEMINKNSIIKFSSYKRSPLFIKDEELRYCLTVVTVQPCVTFSPAICFVPNCSRQSNTRRSVTVNSAPKNTWAWIVNKTVSSVDYR